MESIRRLGEKGKKMFDQLAVYAVGSSVDEGHITPISVKKHLLYVVSVVT